MVHTSPLKEKHACYVIYYMIFIGNMLGAPGYMIKIEQSQPHLANYTSDQYI